VRLWIHVTLVVQTSHPGWVPGRARTLWRQASRDRAITTQRVANHSHRMTLYLCKETHTKRLLVYGYVSQIAITFFHIFTLSKQTSYNRITVHCLIILSNNNDITKHNHYLIRKYKNIHVLQYIHISIMYVKGPQIFLHIKKMFYTECMTCKYIYTLTASK